MMFRKVLPCFVLLGLATWSVRGEQPKAISAEQFDKLQNMIKPQPAELRFQEIPWLLSVWEARQKAATEGKPILVWAGAGGAPVGVC